jgi:hypothetical protein
MHKASVGRRARCTAVASLALAGALALPGCTVVTTTAAVAGAAVSVAGTVVVTGVKATGTVVGWGVDAMTPSKPADHSGVVVKERISDPPPAAAPPATPTPPGTPP